MEYPKVERHRSQSYESSRAESPRTPHSHRVSYDSVTSARLSGANPLRASMDSKDVARASLDIKDIVRASFLREKARISVDNRESYQRSSGELRESPRFGSLKLKDAPRVSVDGRDREGRVETPRSTSSPRLSVRLKEAVRAAVEGRGGDHLRSSSDSSETLGSSVKPRDTPRSSESRLLVELRESPRLSRDAPRYSCDGRDVLRLSVDSSKDTLRAAAQRARESPRLSVDGRGSPRLTRELQVGYNHTRDSSLMNSSQYRALRSELDGGEPRRRVPSLVARLMGLDDLPDDQPSAQLPTTPHRKLSKESKILKGLLQYTPLPEVKSPPEDRQGDFQNLDPYKSRHSSSRHYSDNAAVQCPAGSLPTWKPNHDALGHLKLSPTDLAMETEPPPFEHQQEPREMGALRQKVVQAMPKHFTEAVLTVLKNSDGTKRMPMSYTDMENRLRQLRLRSSLQDHKTLRQILEAMQSKGLLSAPRSRDFPEEGKESYKQQQQQPQEPRHPSVARQIMLPKAQEYGSESTKARNLHELRKLGSKLQEQVLGSTPAEGVKGIRPQLQPISKPLGNALEPSPQEASIVVIKPIGKPAKKIKAQNPALLVESMPGTRSPQGGRESGGKSSPWGSPVNKPTKSQPGYGFGREPTNRFNSEESASFKTRRDRIARATRDIQSEPTTPRSSPKLIALPQPSAKLRSPGSKEAPERSSSRVNLSGSKADESGRKSRSSAVKEKEETSKVSSGSLRSQSSRDLLGAKKTAPEPDRRVLRRSNSDGKMSSPCDKESLKLSTSCAEVTILRSRSSSGKARLSTSDSEARTPTYRRQALAGSKSAGAGEKMREGAGERSRERTVAAPPVSQTCTTPRSSMKSSAEPQRRREEKTTAVQPGSHVRVTDGDAVDQSTARSPLGGLTNRFQNSEVGSGELESRDNQGLRTPRGSILVKKVLSSQEDANLVADIMDMVTEQPQPSPNSVLDGAAFREEDYSPLAVSKILEKNKGLSESREEIDTQLVLDADTALQEAAKTVPTAEAITHVETNSHQLHLRGSSKVSPPEGEDKPVIFQDLDERIYVRDILLVSGATMGIKAVNPSGNPIDCTVYDYLEEKKGIADFGWEKKSKDSHDLRKREDEKERQGRDRRMLFDCVNDVLTTLLVPYVNVKPWMQGLCLPPLRKRPTGQNLVQEVWDELQSLPPKEPCEDICDSLYIVLQKDLMEPQNSWSSFTEEVEEIGLEIERMIFKELIDETMCLLT